MNILQRRSAVIGGVCLMFLVGCGESGPAQPKTYPVSGTVMYNGQRVAAAKVTFMTEGAAKAATGITDSEGKFQLSTYSANDGAIAGDHKITVIKEEAPAAGSAGATGPTDPTKQVNPADIAATYRKVQEGGLSSGSKSTLPARYGSQSTTP